MKVDIEKRFDEAKTSAGHALDHAAEAGQHVRTDAERAVDRTAQQVGAAVDGLATKAQGAVDDLRHTSPREMIDGAKSNIDDAKTKVEALGTQVGDKADDVIHATGEHLSEMADTVRAKSPTGGPVGDLAASGADALDRSGSYLQQADLGDIRNDLETVIRRHPVESLVVGLGLGYLVARAIRS
jgi:hypothetical protein